MTAPISAIIAFLGVQPVFVVIQEPETPNNKGRIAARC